MALAAIAAFLFGYIVALKLVGYGVRQGTAQIIRVTTYRMGRCRCALCAPDPPPRPRIFIDNPFKDIS